MLFLTIKKSNKHDHHILLGSSRCDTHRSNPDLRYPVYIIDTKKHSVYICKIKESKHGYMKILCYILLLDIHVDLDFSYLKSKSELIRRIKNFTLPDPRIESVLRQKPLCKLFTFTACFANLVIEKEK